MTAVAVVVALLVPHGVDGSPWESVQATAPAVRVATTVQVAEPPPTLPPIPDWARCPDYWDVARAVGWPEDALPTLDGVMWHESRCQPNAHNRSGAAGMLQLMPMWWRGRDPYDPATNLAIGLDIYRHEGGWCPAWRGDPAVGRC